MEKVKKKKDLDMLNGTLWNKLVLFALPVAATALLEQLFNASDIAVVGNFTGELKTVAVAAVGANTSLIGLLVNLFVGIALGTNVVIANAIGRDDKPTVQKAVHTSIIIAVVGGILIAGIGELLAEPVLSLLGVPSDVFPYALMYLRIYLLGMPVILLYNFEAAIFRSVGDTKIPLAALACSGVLNVLLNLFFVIVLKMTVNGVAIATVISNAVSSAILLLILLRTDKCIRFEFKKLRFDFYCFKRIMKIGLPSGIQSSMFSVSNIIIQGAINSLGTVVMAASSAACNVELFAYFVLNAFSQACTTFVGQNYGAGKIDRCKKTLALSLIEDAVATATAIALVLLSGRFMLSIFNSDPEVVEIGYTRLKILFFAYAFTMTYEVISGYLRGFGISLTPAVIVMVGICVVRIIWIKTVFPVYHTFNTIMIAYPVSLCITAIMMSVALLIYRPAKNHSKVNAKYTNL